MGGGRCRERSRGVAILGCAHTQANFKDAFWRTDLLDYKPFETWEEEGARDTQALAILAGAAEPTEALDPDGKYEHVEASAVTGAGVQGDDTEDRILDVMDLVWGWCPPHLRVWDTVLPK
mgnify:CR=1 FL=1